MSDFEKRFITAFAELTKELNKREIQVLLGIIKLSCIDKHFSISQNLIARETEMAQPAVSVILESLREKRVIIGDRINPDIAKKMGI